MPRKDETDAKRVFDRIAERYYKARANKELFFNEFLEIPATVSMLQGLRGKRVLDIGCGSGLYARIMKQKGATVYGIDISPKVVAIARREVTGVDFRIGSVYKLPYTTGYFDVAVAPLVMDYVSDISKALGEVHRVLRKNGILIFSLPNPVTQSTKHLYDDRSSELCRVFKDYFKEGMRKQRWNYDKKSLGKRHVIVSLMHVTYQTLIKAIITNGFVIEDYVDARPTIEGKKANPKAYALTSKVPWFCVFKVKKVR